MSRMLSSLWLLKAKAEVRDVTFSASIFDSTFRISSAMPSEK